MLSKTKISRRARKKTNQELVETINLAKKQNQELASILSKPTRQHRAINLDEINKAKQEAIIFPGKVLGSGEIEEKKKIIALSFSKSAEEKLKNRKIEFSTIREELEKNKGKKLEGEILK